MNEEFKKVKDVPGKRQCEQCGKEYTVLEYGIQMPGTKDWELIECPCCGHTVMGWTNGIWFSKIIE